MTTSSPNLFYYLAILMLCGIGPLHSTAADLPIDADGWSVYRPSADSRIIYCSDSEGDDANDGLSEATPVKRLDQAFSLLRDGYPDHVYLKRGDTWTDQDFQELIKKSGRSDVERIVVAYYGSGRRPLVKPNGPRFFSVVEKTWSNIAILGIEFYNYTANPKDPDFVDPGYRDVNSGIVFQKSRVFNFLLEDCKISYFKYNVSVFNRSHGGGDAFINLDFRRNIIVNAYNVGSEINKTKSQGMFISHTKELLIEENFFDHNGWNENVAFNDSALANQYNHNVYLSSDNEGPCVVRGNVVSEGAAHGVQLRSGGTAERNAFIGNAVGMNLGFENPPTYYTGTTVARDNVFTDGRPQIPGDLSNPQTGAIWGLWKQTISNVTVNNNIVANLQNSEGGNVRPYAGGLQDDPNAYGTGNIGWNWKQENFPATDPGWTDPTRDKESFAAAQGYASYGAWTKGASNRSIRSFPAKFTAYDYVDYIRAGFDMPAVERPYNNKETPSNTIVIRAQGDCGLEDMELRIDGTRVANWQDVATTPTDYVYGEYGGAGQISVHFTNNNNAEQGCADKNLLVDYIQVCGTIYQTEAVASKTSTCCAESLDKLFTNGDFNFGSLSCESTEGNVVVRARGKTGSEEIVIRYNDERVGDTITLSTTYQKYKVQVNQANGNFKVAFVNDEGPQDAEIDWLQVGSTKRQAETRSTNTAVWQNNSCGGSKSQLMNCNGYIDFGTMSDATSGKIVVRAKGSVGSEQMSLLVDGKVAKSWTVTTTADNYRYEGYSGGRILLRFDNDGGSGGEDRNLAINYVEVCGDRQEAEEASNSAGAGCSDTFSGFVWLWCNDSLDFGNVGCNSNARTVAKQDKSTLEVMTSEWFRSYPNPVSEQLTVEGSEDYQVTLYDLSGQAVMRHDHLRGKATLDVSHLRPGVYVVRFYGTQHPSSEQKIIIE